MKTKECKYCSESITFEHGYQMGAHVSNCKMNPKEQARILAMIQPRNQYSFNCELCDQLYTLQLTQTHYDKKKYTRYCSRKCANTRSHSEDTKLKISISLHAIEGCEIYTPNCKYCDQVFTTQKETKIYCSNQCLIDHNKETGFYQKHGRVGGLKSVQVQTKRSKNEIYFAELCQEHFDKVQCNEAIFNGWDADVIIHDYKIAVLWNGKWHYEKITEKHSVKQVQNRDAIKMKEIQNADYIPYIIKDMGSYNPIFVEDEFSKFLVAIAGFEPTVFL
jgi:hypothetical protein